MISGWTFIFVEFAAVDTTEDWRPTAVQMDLEIFTFASVSVFIFGMFFGLLELRLFENRYANKSFIRKLFFKFLIYGAIVTSIIFLTFPIAVSMDFDVGVFSNVVWQKYINFFFSLTHLSTLVQLFVAIVLSLFYSEISSYMGSGALQNFLTGRYKSPITETRVFMFLDMKSSTTIAEKLGHEKYFQFLKMYYADLSEPVILHDGDVYQYVGDEIVVSWKVDNMPTVTTAIDCYIDMKKRLISRRSVYQAQFDVFPEFKAGLHVGDVTAGEIGVIKKEILFTGDVLNATARIQALCNTLEQDILISGDMVEVLNLSDQLEILSMGTEKLRGRNIPMDLFTLKIGLDTVEENGT